MQKTTHENVMTEQGYLPSLTALAEVEPLPPMPEIPRERRRGPHFTFEVKCALKERLSRNASTHFQNYIAEVVDRCFEEYGHGHVRHPSRWHFREGKEADSVEVCFGLHTRGEECVFEKFVLADGHVDAESYRTASLGWQRSQMETDAGALLLAHVRRFADSHLPIPEWLIRAINAHLDDINNPHPLHRHRVDCLAEADAVTVLVAGAWTYGAQGAQMKGPL